MHNGHSMNDECFTIPVIKLIESVDAVAFDAGAFTINRCLLRRFLDGRAVVMNYLSMCVSYRRETK